MPVFLGHSAQRPARADTQKYRLPRQPRAVCHGAAELPNPVAQERCAPAVGKGKGLPPARVYSHICRNDYHMVPSELRHAHKPR